MNLSKSLYIRGLQCTKSLWLKKYKPEVLTPPDKQTLAIFETGDKVGALACNLFPYGKEIPFEGTTFDEENARVLIEPPVFCLSGEHFLLDDASQHDGAVGPFGRSTHGGI